MFEVVQQFEFKHHREQNVSSKVEIFLYFMKLILIICIDSKYQIIFLKHLITTVIGLCSEVNIHGVINKTKIVKITKTMNVN